MPSKRRVGGQQHSGKGGQRPAPSSASIRARKVQGEEAWELVYPRCALERREDLEEVQKMIAAGETDVAVDELRWLLDGCSDMLEAHTLLGELALLEGDTMLARGHFGYAYQLGIKALEQAKAQGPLPYRLDANKPFFQAGKGLIWALAQLGKRETAGDVRDRLLALDASDPLAIKQLGRDEGDGSAPTPASG